MHETLHSVGSVSPSPVADYLAELYEKYRDLHDGAVATYIPELAKADPEAFGIALVTTGGRVYQVGEARRQFTIQSISKPFVYGMALEDHGRVDVLKKIGVEPSGDVFNAISLDPGTGRPLNPMINAGAIAATGMISGKSHKTRLERLLRAFSLYAGREVRVDESVYRSENETGHRNRAIGHLLRNSNVLAEDPIPVVDLYFKQCSLSVDCVDLATMAATLANHGVNPRTGGQALRGEYVESVLSVMGSCGMYDFAGEWIYEVGMPAKSGVAGGIIAVLPGQFGICVYSPRLDVHGNSVRGIRVCADLSRRFDLHLFNPPQANEAAIRLKFTADEVTSSRLRLRHEMQVLREEGAAIALYELQGRLAFSTVEVVMSEVAQTLDRTRFVILDLRRVLGLNESACRLFHGFILRLAEWGTTVVFNGADRFPLLRRFFRAKCGEALEVYFRNFEDRDLALEWCEDRLIERHLPEAGLAEVAVAADYELLDGLSAEEIETVTALFQHRHYAAGETIIEAGAEAREFFFLRSGVVSVFVPTSDGGNRRLAALSRGMTFGEMSVIDGARRSATVLADTEVKCDLLYSEDFNRLIETHPRIKVAMLRNLSLALCGKLRKANRERGVFEM